MKIAVAATTIYKPDAIELLREHGPDVRFFVAGDRKTPQEVEDWCADQDGVTYLSPRMQQSLGYKCSELLGWDTLARRNIATLEGIKWGADVIVVWDNDNIPLDRVPNGQFNNYFNHFRRALRHDYNAGTFNGLKVSSPTGWFDVGQLLDPIAPHRGFPHDVEATKYEVAHTTNARVGVAAGICLGDPDISAVTRIARAPIVHRASEILQSGVVVDPATRTVFNTQNTAFIRELSPAMFMMPGVGRFDDIYASLISQRLMRERDLHVHFGKPFVWQQRNPHNLIKDLRAEIDGMDNILDFAEALDGLALEEGASAVDHTAQCYQELFDECGVIPPKAHEAAFAFLEDIKGVL